MKPIVSIIIPNFNGKEYLDACLESIGEQSLPGIEVILVDDASSDGSAAEAEQKYPGIKVLYHTENQGFCKSCNDGVRLAAAPYVILLNNDTVCDKDFAKHLYRMIKRDARYFSAQAKMVSLQNPEILDDGGDELTMLGWVFAPGKDKAADGCRNRKIFSACGGAVIYRKDVYLALGGLDEEHFAYFEDVDLGYRARLFGYENVLAAKAVVLHAGSGTTGSRYNAFKARYSARNNVYFLFKNMPNWQLLLNGFCIFTGFCIKAIFYGKKGLWKEYQLGLREGLRLTKTRKEKRVEFQKVPLRRLWKIQMRMFAWTIRRFIG